MFIEATRRVSRELVQPLLAAITEYDRIVFSEVDVEPEQAFHIVQDRGEYVVAFSDPTIPEPVEERTYDCGD